MASRNLDWHVALAGECIASRPFAMHDDAASMAVIDLLRPVEMGRLARDGTITRRTGQGEHPLTEGRPLIARGETAERTLGRIQRLSKQFETEMTVDEEIGLIRL
jgi:hypothetical protein